VFGISRNDEWPAYRPPPPLTLILIVPRPIQIEQHSCTWRFPIAPACEFASDSKRLGEVPRIEAIAAQRAVAAAGLQFVSYRPAVAANITGPALVALDAF
jgi:hypothetical protein